MTESALVNGWIRQGGVCGELRQLRQHVIELLEIRFPEAVTPDLVKLVEHQEALSQLEEWFRAIAGAERYDDFLRVLRG